MADKVGTAEGGIYHFLVGGALERGRLDGQGGFVIVLQENGRTRLVGQCQTRLRSTTFCEG